jgi:hypothetical protein
MPLKPIFFQSVGSWIEIMSSISSDSDNDDNEPLSPVIFRLLNGNIVKVIAKDIKKPFRPHETLDGESPEITYYLIVFSNENTFENTPVNQFALEPGIDFTEETAIEMLALIRDQTGVDSRHDFEELEEFTEWLIDNSARIAECPEDAVRHYKKIAELTYPEASDYIDDSFFNDQND